ncbi:hypothetical protein [Streptacidiphilus cavernicola]|uniref:Uncharacterized protein n=1 Tax=Streptacidiphilus cavernicola TaxID=3342716 RepID=A0ABV6VYS5_9ACTN
MSSPRHDTPTSASPRGWCVPCRRRRALLRDERPNFRIWYCAHCGTERAEFIKLRPRVPRQLALFEDAA